MQHPLRSWLALVCASFLVAACASQATPAPAPAQAPAAAPAKAAAPEPASAAKAPDKPAAAAQPAKPAEKPAAAQPAKATQLKKIKMGSIRLVNFMPAWVANELGYFRDEGLDVEFVEMQSGNELRTALLGRSVDAITSAIEGPMIVFQQGAVTKNIVGMLLRSNYVLVVQPDFAGQMGDVKALKGRKVGMTGAGSGSDVTLRGVLRDAGLDPDKDVTVIAVGAGPSSVAAMKAKQIDGMITFEPNLGVAIDQQVAKIFLDLRDPQQGGKWAKVANSSIQATDAWLTANPDAAKALVRSIVKANNTIRTDKETTIKVMESVFKLERRLLEKMCATECPAFNSAITEEIHKAVNDAFKGAGVLKADIPYGGTTGVEFKDLWK